MEVVGQGCFRDGTDDGSSYVSLGQNKFRLNSVDLNQSRDSGAGMS